MAGARAFSAVGLALVCAAGCDNAPSPGVAPLVESTTPAPSAYFSDVTNAVGVDFVHQAGATGDHYLPEIIGPGAALFDYDNDGDLDLYLVQGGGAVIGDAPRAPNRLYRNDLELGALRFTDVTDQAGVADRTYGMGVATGDVDNDGDVDLYVTNFGPNVLYRNNADGTFTRVVQDVGVDHEGWSASASFADYDADGWLDLFVTHYVEQPVRDNRPCKNPIDRRDYCSPTVFKPTSDTLYRNIEGRRFADVSESSGISLAKGAGLGVVAADFDRDGLLDFFVANDQSANFLWRNQGDGRFAEVGLMSGSAYNAHGMAEASMGVTAADFDGDGDVDLFMTHLKTQTNTLYANDGTGGFTDATDRVRLGNASLVFTGFGALWFDVDHDMDLDIFIANGAVVMEPERAGDSRFPYEQRNQLFVLDDQQIYREWRSAVPGPLDQLATSRGAAFGDLDNDGDIDIVVANANAAVQVLQNRHDVKNDWLGLDLRLTSGRAAIGARVALRRPDQPLLWRRVTRDGSYLSANDPRVHFGVGEDHTDAALGVVWPDGQREQWDAMAPGDYHVLVQGSGRPWPSGAEQ